MSNGNGVIWKVIISIIIPILFFMGTNLIASDKDSRSRDEKIMEKLTISVEQQTKTNVEMLLALNTMQSDIKYIRKEVVTSER